MYSNTFAKLLLIIAGHKVVEIVLVCAGRPLWLGRGRCGCRCLGRGGTVRHWRAEEKEEEEECI
jgi:hypothetical protein